MQSSAREDGQYNCLKHVELIGIINKPLLLYLGGCQYYFYQWCTVKQISNIMEGPCEVIRRQSCEVCPNFDNTNTGMSNFVTTVTILSCFSDIPASNLPRNPNYADRLFVVILRQSRQIREFYINEGRSDYFRVLSSSYGDKHTTLYSLSCK